MFNQRGREIDREGKEWMSDREKEKERVAAIIRKETNVPTLYIYPTPLQKAGLMQHQILSEVKLLNSEFSFS